MEITVGKSLLQDIFSRVSRVIEQKSISPMAGTVKMHVDDKGLVFTAKGNEVFVQAIIGDKDFTVTGDKYGVCIPANIFVQLLPKLPQYFNNLVKLVITPKSDGDYVLAVTPPDSIDKKSKYQIEVLDGSSFFELPEVDEKNSIILNNEGLLEIINKVPFAAAEEQYYVPLLGVKFFSKNGQLTTATTDSHRIVELILDLDKTVSKDVDFLCYANGVEDLKNIFDFGEGISNVDISYGNSYVKFSQDKKAVYIRLIDGDFPDYKGGVIPSTFVAELEIDSTEWLEYIQPAALLTNVRLIMSFAPEGVTLVAQSDKGSSLDTFDNIKWLYGPTIKRIMFSANYLNEQLKKFEGDTITLKIVGEDSPVIITNGQYLHYLSCINVKDQNEDEDQEENEE